MEMAGGKMAKPMQTEIEAFRRALEGMLHAHHEKGGNVGSPPSVVMEPGKRYVRIVVQNGASRYAYGFIEWTTGNLLKSDGWKAPAKHARGNIRADNPLSGCGPYGMAYLR